MVPRSLFFFISFHFIQVYYTARAHCVSYSRLRIINVHKCTDVALKISSLPLLLLLLLFSFSFFFFFRSDTLLSFAMMYYVQLSVRCYVASYELGDAAPHWSPLMRYVCYITIIVPSVRLVAGMTFVYRCVGDLPMQSICNSGKLSKWHLLLLSQRIDAIGA